ncbi:unnamed protein product [Phytophthora fragariaefolia]|uniref:Unnamed protein product n=1 Tax=Phytophthora fragariaefolia TaxID=1490495 RepID=A0A9W6XZ14_9STRA|nr:unnamed protein product [Phytophthora fragariaefolia]
MAVTVSGALDANFVVAGDRQGRISVWERDAGKVSVFVPISGDGIHSMAMSPHDKTVVAVGYRSGVLCVVDAVHSTIRYRLTGHDQEVQCVAWKAAVSIDRLHKDDEEDVVEPGRTIQDVWLASSSRDKTIKVWRLATNLAEEPALEQVLRLPTGKQGMSFTQTKQLWLPVAWAINENETGEKLGRHCIWSGSFDGSLLRWEWNAEKAEHQEQKGKKRAACKPMIVKGGHTRMLFSIVMVPPRSVVPAEKDTVSMLTVSLDRELRLWTESLSSKSLPAATCVEKLTGLGGHAYAVSYNSTLGLVAAGVGDQTIRLWELGNDATSAPSDYQCELLWKGLQSKVTCVRWHPFQQSLLAYGMEDGRIGVYDIRTNKYTHLRASHGNEVLQLQWVVLRPNGSANGDDGDSSFLENIKQLEVAQAEGQSLEQALTAQEQHRNINRDGDDVKILLWSCDASGRVLESNIDTADQISREILCDCVSFEWNEHRDLVAIGRCNGVVEILKREEIGASNSNSASHRFHEHLEGVTSLAWNNGSNTGLLASGGDDGKIFVYICENICAPDATDMPGSSAEVNCQGSRLFGSITAHSNKVTDVKWCANIDHSRLASCSSDGTVLVWGFPSLQREAHFNHHVGRVLSLVWVSQYTLVTGGEDQTLRLWDCRDQPRHPPSQKKKQGKVRQPHEVEIVATLRSEKSTLQDTTGTGAVAEPGPAGSTDAEPSDKTKAKRKAIFHPERKPTSAEIASACSRLVKGGDANRTTKKCDDGVADSAKLMLLTNSGRAQLQDFFATQVKRFRDEQEWESLANTLLIQGKITEALRIVAKESSLSPTWLSLAPMAGMDVWREMTNLYAHQLDAQGDKKTAVRSAVACLVSGDAYEEAIALIRSRMGPRDPLMHDTLWKYSKFLSRRGRHGEEALVLLNIGSVKATTRAVHALVNTGDMVSIKTAVEVLVSAVESPAKLNHQGEGAENGGGELSFPVSFFISIASRALVQAHYDIAETAAKLLLTRLAGASSSSLYRLIWCVIGIVKTIDEHRLRNWKRQGAELAATQGGKALQSDVPPTANEFFEWLLRPHQDSEDGNSSPLYFSVVDAFVCSHKKGKLGELGIKGPANQFWSQVHGVCQRSGYWFGSNYETRVQEAQSALVEANCFGDFEKSIEAASSEQHKSAIALLLLQISRGLLCFMIDVVSGSFIGALEQMREVFQLLAGEGIHGNDGLRFEVMILLCPGGFISPKGLPQCGELADEQPDTLVLWSSIFLSQCRVALSTIALSANSTEDCKHRLESLIRSLLHLLRVSFIIEGEMLTLSKGLKNAINQSQLQALLNETVVAAQLLPDESEISQIHHVENFRVEITQDEASKNRRSRKQALLDDTNELRSCLTWSDNDLK